jgi:hypothetical protein
VSLYINVNNEKNFSMIFNILSNHYFVYVNNRDDNVLETITTVFVLKIVLLVEREDMSHWHGLSNRLINKNDVRMICKWENIFIDRNNTNLYQQDNIFE